MESVRALVVSDDRELLRLIYRDYDQAPVQYRVTSYWKLASDRKRIEVEQKCLSSFRQDIYFTKGYAENLYPPFFQQYPPLKQRLLDFLYGTWPFSLAFKNYKNREAKLTYERSTAYREKIGLMHMLLTQSPETASFLAGAREYCAGDPNVIDVINDVTTPNFVV